MCIVYDPTDKVKLHVLISRTLARVNSEKELPPWDCLKEYLRLLCSLVREFFRRRSYLKFPETMERILIVRRLVVDGLLMRSYLDGL